MRPTDLSPPEAEDLSRGMRYRIQVYAADCTGCSSCAVVCPGHALTMRPIATQLQQQELMLAWSEKHVSEKPQLLPRFTIQGSQLNDRSCSFQEHAADAAKHPT